MIGIGAWDLTPAQRARLETAEAFAARCVRPRAAAFDAAAQVPRALFDECARHGFLGLTVGAEHGGAAGDHVTLGLLHYAIGRACSSVRSIITVHAMVCDAIQRWGAGPLRDAALPSLARGERLAAFALTEAEAGSDIQGIRADARPDGDGGWRLSGEKLWITGGQLADVFLVFAREGERGPAAYLVERDADGAAITPTPPGLGLRGAMLATLTLRDCRVDPGARVGRPGFGLSAVAAAALDLGRFTVAWGCIGLAEAALDASFAHAARRVQGSRALREQPLIAAMLSDRVTELRAAALLCLQAAHLRDRRDAGALLEACMAKLAASRLARRAADDAVQIHGASGCAAGHLAERFCRDARIMEIIEGSTQVQQTLIADLAYAHAFVR